MALSYAWGDSGKPALALVDAQSVAIPSTLVTALRDMRDSNRVRKTGLMPCALENPIVEKKVQQVANMG